MSINIYINLNLWILGVLNPIILTLKNHKMSKSLDYLRNNNLLLCLSIDICINLNLWILGVLDPIIPTLKSHNQSKFPDYLRNNNHLLCMLTNIYIKLNHWIYGKLETKIIQKIMKNLKLKLNKDLTIKMRRIKIVLQKMKMLFTPISIMNKINL